MMQQVLPRRYIDRQKLGVFWRTHPDFKDHTCSIEVSALARDYTYTAIAETLTRSEKILTWLWYPGKWTR